TSAGLFAVAFGMAGGSVVVPETEFPANLYPWVRAADAGRIDLRTFPVPEGRLTADLVVRAVDARTTAVSLSHVDYRTGYRCDLPAIREAAGNALLVVDAVQGLGALRFSMEHVDVMVAGGHKWLRAGGGAGLLAVSERALERLRPTLTGWLGVGDPFDTSAPLPHPPLEGADRFVMGSAGFTAVAALCESLRTLQTVPMEYVEAAVIARSIAVEEEARRAGARVLSPWLNDDERSGIVSFTPAGGPSEDAYTRLVGEGFSLTERNGMLRVAPHASTHPDAPAAMGRVLAG
ncbi:MAG: aminotransferase class V-fold PLP-dependent enzyme, partial [bacterium]|nr:aminotransferase class V-fold PLP-dependent enzyme [bacterium]